MEEVDEKEGQGAVMSSVSKLAAAIITHILQGHCFSQRNLPSPAFFTDYIFQSLNRTSNLQILGNLSCVIPLLLPRMMLLLLFDAHRSTVTMPFLSSDLEELLHQLGVGRGRTVHSHSRARRSITGTGHRLDGCVQETQGTSSDWGQVRVRQRADLVDRKKVFLTNTLFSQ